MGKEGCVCLDSQPEEGYAMLWWDAAGNGLADRRPSLAADEGLYYGQHQRKSVTLFLLILVS